MKVGQCPVCMSNGELPCKMSCYKVCTKCGSEDYVVLNKAKEVLSAVDSTMRLHLKRREFNKTPQPDQYVKNMPIWKRKTLEDFLESMPKIDPLKVKELREKNMSKLEIAKELGVDLYFIIRHMRMNAMRDGLSVKDIRTQREKKLDDAYFNAVELFNKRVANSDK